MNATEDGDEPVGEAPVIEVSWPVLMPDATGVMIAEPGRIENIPVLGENERQTIAEIRELHAKESCCGTCDARNHFKCASCGWGLNGNGWPCETALVLDARGL